MFVTKFFEGKVPRVHAVKGADQLADLGRSVAPKVSAFWIWADLLLQR